MRELPAAKQDLCLLDVSLRKPPKRRLWRKQQGGFEEVSQFSRHNVAGNRLTRRCSESPKRRRWHTFPSSSFFLSPTAYFLSTATKSMQKAPFETEGFKTSFTFKSCVRYGPSRELTQQQTRCRSRSGEGNVASIAGEYGLPR